MAIDAQKAGGVMPVALNGANEEAVAAFLDERIPFGGIARTVETVLARTENASVREIGDVYEADRRARFMARDVLRALV